MLSNTDLPRSQNAHDNCGDFWIILSHLVFKRPAILSVQLLKEILWVTQFLKCLNFFFKILFVKYWHRKLRKCFIFIYHLLNSNGVDIRITNTQIRKQYFHYLWSIFPSAHPPTDTHFGFASQSKHLFLQLCSHREQLFWLFW